MSSTFGNRLLEARTAAGLSTRSLAERLTGAGHAISHVTISKYERDEFSPTYDTLVALAGALGKDLAWFDGTSCQLSGIRFRAQKTLSQRAKDSFAIEATPWIRLFTYVSELLDRKQPAELQVKARSSDSGSVLAKRVREKYGLGAYPVPSVAKMLTNFGILVLQRPGAVGIDAFAAQFGSHRVVVVNAALPPDRMRLTLAHELGHVLFDDCSHTRQVDESAVESRAFEFASHLLMPSSVLRKAFEMRSMVRLVQYKEFFGISLAAMVYRAKQEKILPDSMVQMLWREFSRLGWRRNEPGRVSADSPLRMEALVDGALREKKVTIAELGRVSGLPAEAIQTRIVEATGASVARSDDVSAPSFRISAYLGDGHTSENLE